MRNSASTKNLCKVKEVADGSEFGIDFSIAVPNCKEVSNCNFFVLKDLLAPLFIDEPIKSKPEAKLGKCTCNLLGRSPGENRTLPGQKSTGKLLDFIYTPTEPCTPERCWLKYNQFVSLVKSKMEPGKSYRNQSSNGNHWDIKCNVGSPSLEGLKTYRELRKLLPQQARAKVERETGILPEIPTPKEESSPKPSLPKESLPDGRASNHVDVDVDVRPAQLSEDIDSADSEVTRHTVSEEVIQLEEQDASLELEKQNAEAFMLKLESSIQLFKSAQASIAVMVAKAVDFTSICGKKRDGGELSESMLVDAAAMGDMLGQNIVALAKWLQTNVESSYAFEFASMIEELPTSEHEELLQDLVDVIKLQGDASDELYLLQVKLISAVKALKEQDAISGKVAHSLADSMVDSLRSMKIKVSEATRKLMAIHIS